MWLRALPGCRAGDWDPAIYERSSCNEVPSAPSGKAVSAGASADGGQMRGGSSQNGSDPGPNPGPPSTPASLAAEASPASNGRSNGAGSAGASSASPMPDLAASGASARDGGGDGGGGGGDAKTSLVDARWTAYVGEETAPQARPQPSHYNSMT